MKGCDLPVCVSPYSEDCPTPILLFSQGQRRVHRDGQCCEECVSPAGSCWFNGVVRYQDEMWKGSACEFCTCERGQVTCRNGECAKVECAQVRHKGVSLQTLAVLSNRVGGPAPVPYWEQRQQPG